jgi:ADP-ribose pyrophosphatase YjhB (NUDIX family)
MPNKELINYLQTVQAIAKVGLSYAQDPYDLERYASLRDLTNSMLSQAFDFPREKIETSFESMDGYPTPKVDVRGVVINNGQVLLIKEKTDGKWALPGGWCDIGLSPKENVEKEVREEAGIVVEATRLLAVWDKKCHDQPIDINYVYKLCFECNILEGELNHGHEALDASYFDINKLPELSLPRNTPGQVVQLVKMIENKEAVSFD